jgi:hypothetical protein
LSHVHHDVVQPPVSGLPAGHIAHPVRREDGANK